MKNLSVILNVILVVAVGILFFLHFKGNNNATNLTTPTDSTALKAKGKAIVYIDSDTLFKKYDYAVEVQKLIDDKKNAAQNTLKSKQDVLKLKFNEYQNKAAYLTESERASTEKKLQDMQIDLENSSIAMENSLIKESTELNEKLRIKLEGFLKDYAQQNGHTYIIQYSRVGSGVLYGDKALDITNDVIAKLNTLYKTEKEAASGN